MEKSNRVSLRLTSEQYDFLCRSAKLISVSPSEFLRFTLNASMMTAKTSPQTWKTLQAISLDDKEGVKDD